MILLGPLRQQLIAFPKLFARQLLVERRLADEAPLERASIAHDVDAHLVRPLDQRLLDGHDGGAAGARAHVHLLVGVGKVATELLLRTARQQHHDFGARNELRAAHNRATHLHITLIFNLQAKKK